MVRPTSDRVKESLFNIISSYIGGAQVLDLFAGTGSLGIESLSRGAFSAVFADKSSTCIALIKENLAHTGLAGKAEVEKGTAGGVIQKMSHSAKKFDIILMDPPYNKGYVLQTLNIIEKNGIIKTNGIIAVERDMDEKIPEAVGKLVLFREQAYGGTVISFFSGKMLEK